MSLRRCFKDNFHRANVGSIPGNGKGFFVKYSSTNVWSSERKETQRPWKVSAKLVSQNFRRDDHCDEGRPLLKGVNPPSLHDVDINVNVTDGYGVGNAALKHFTRKFILICLVLSLQTTITPTQKSVKTKWRLIWLARLSTQHQKTLLQQPSSTLV